MSAPERNLKVELWAALVLTALIATLHLVRAANAGPLWRDEVASVQLALLPSFKDVVLNFTHEAFPPLFPAIVRTYCAMAGQTDVALRVFGACVGLLLIGALWWICRSTVRGVPLLSLALLGLSPDVLQWGDTVRGYGLGMVFILLMVGLLWQAIQQPTPWRFAVAAAAAIASVQCLLQNTALVLAACLAGMLVGWRRRSPRIWLSVLAVGILSAISLLPYLGLIGDARRWDIVVRTPISLPDLVVELWHVFSSAGWWNGCLWVLLLLGAIAIGLFGLRSRASWLSKDKKRDCLLFSTALLLSSFLAYLLLLRTVNYHPRSWYYLALVATLATVVDLNFQLLSQYAWAASGRLALALLILAGGLIPVWRQARTRQSNIDLVAAKSAELATKDDLIVVVPWTYGISFQRYYKGQARWQSVPPIDFFKFHRFDLIKEKMTTPDLNEVIRPLLEQINQVLRAEHRVWVVGQLQFPGPGEFVPTLSSPPDPEWGWREEAYSAMWSMKIGAYLQGSAPKKRTIDIPIRKAVSQFESCPLNVFE